MLKTKQVKAGRFCSRQRVLGESP